MNRICRRFCIALLAVLASGAHARGPRVTPIDKGTIAGFVDFTPRGTQPALAFQLQDSENCATCHTGNLDEPHMAYDGWAGSMMANAARDPLFWAALDVANRDGAENGAAGIGDFCLRCHAPQAWYGGRVRKLHDVPSSGVSPESIVEGSNGCKLAGRHDYGDFGNDYGGVSCQFCHRIQAQGPQGQASFLENADLWLDDSDCNGQGQPCRAGPYRYPHSYEHPQFGTVVYNAPPHPHQFSALHSDSALCGSCHDVTTPMLESGPFRTLIVADGSPEGLDTGRAFPAERTYREWLHSDHARVVFRDGIEAADPAKLARGQTCQGCHMPQATPPAAQPGLPLQACSVGGPPRNGELPTHEFAGGNAWVPGLLKGLYPDLGREEAFDRTTSAARRLLSQHSATITTQASLASVPGDAWVLALTTRVINHAGHKLPTGYAEGRRMWIAIDVRDAQDMVVWRNGEWDAATGVLAADAQTKIYEIKQGIWDAASGTCRTTDGQGRAEFHFVLNNCIAKDNRIPPAGFRGASDPETAAYGYTYASLAPGVSSHIDATHYSVPIPAGISLPLHITATLRFQVASREYIEFLRDQALERGFPAENVLCAGEPGRPFPVGPADASRGQFIYSVWNDPAYGKSPPIDMASAAIQVMP